MCRALVVDQILSATEVESLLSVDDVLLYWLSNNLIFDARNEQKE